MDSIPEFFCGQNTTALNLFVLYDWLDVIDEILFSAGVTALPFPVEKLYVDLFLKWQTG